MIIGRGPFGLWHEIIGHRYVRVFEGNLSAVFKRLKAEGISEVDIDRSSPQRTRIEHRILIDRKD